MRRWMIAALVLVVTAAAPLSAELKVTTKVTLRKVAAAPGGDMMAAMVTPMFVQMFGGEAGLETTTVIHEDGRTRVEYPTGFATLPAGTVMLVRADGSSVGFDPKAGTWWKMPGTADMPAEAAALMAQMKPTVTSTPTGESATIAGLRATRSTFQLVMPLPLPPEAADAPPELLAMIPKQLTMDGEVWLAPSLVKYSQAQGKAMAGLPLSQFGFDKLATAFDGFMVKQVMRMSLLVGYEMETVVVTAAEQDEPDSAFEVPQGFKEVQMPGGMGGWVADR